MKYSFASVLSSSPLIVSLFSINLQHYRERIAVCVSVPLLLICGTTSASVAQQIGKGPAFSNFQPSTINPSDAYSLDTGVTCPTPSFSVVGFGGNASDYVRPAALDYSSNSGLDSYGIAAGISVPLGGQLAKFCSDFAELRTNDLLKRIKIIEAKFQTQLVQQCYNLLTLHINFDEKYYDEDGPGAALFPCRSIVKTIQPPKLLTNPPPDTSSQQPPSNQNRENVITEPEPLTPRPTITFPIR